MESIILLHQEMHSLFVEFWDGPYPGIHIAYQIHV